MRSLVIVLTSIPTGITARSLFCSVKNRLFQQCPLASLYNFVFLPPSPPKKQAVSPKIKTLIDNYHLCHIIHNNYE